VLLVFEKRRDLAVTVRETKHVYLPSGTFPGFQVQRTWRQCMAPQPPVEDVVVDVFKSKKKGKQPYHATTPPSPPQCTQYYVGNKEKPNKKPDLHQELYLATMAKQRRCLGMFEVADVWMYRYPAVCTDPCQTSDAGTCRLVVFIDKRVHHLSKRVQTDTRRCLCCSRLDQEMRFSTNVFGGHCVCLRSCTAWLNTMHYHTLTHNSIALKNSALCFCRCL